MGEDKKPYNRNDWVRVILCGLILGGILGYNLYCVRCYVIGMDLLLPLNWCLYCIVGSGFHLLEFFLTAIYRPNDLCFDSFLVNQSVYYAMTTTSGIMEFFIEYYFFPLWKQNQVVIQMGILLTVFGIVLRAAAEIQMGTNFTHIIRTEHVNSHELVTSGIYSLFRHPSYTGWFYYNVGRELILCNPVCVVISALVNWGLLYFRIPFEEKYLMSFFPEYEEYRKHTYIMIPFLPNSKS